VHPIVEGSIDAIMNDLGNFSGSDMGGGGGLPVTKIFEKY